MREVCFERTDYLIVLHFRCERDGRIKEQNIDGIAQIEQWHLVCNERNREVVKRNRADEWCFCCVLWRGVLRQREHIKICSTILTNKRIKLRICQGNLADTQLAIFEQGYNINTSHSFLSGQYGIRLCTNYRILYKNAICAKTKLRESREERQLHLPYLVVAGDECIRYFAHYWCEALRRKYPIHQYPCNYQHQAE